ncbi:DEHA2B06534p [Debaryomyces hansenii CBS767]|uniref:DEHA2B06534p n=1 Tax=Debaryomyces hansenii (strain ATCC 36239 / CBS 767 / BCRC 21394 / JCM 1990 / NBRC 0083 / IGC 2968) TaxID=284592 RepID=Q6BX26_DEBHA|nr:DEHA2B06534p [Debaryomyces hansenii CBS767]CAG85241.2 DEHA2B06534p [Debaryomyces hansenii CBS767]|eukprot:XP_457243.2 DEHA2B06534p [Debaryomyces hansenii CBS767]
MYRKLHREASNPGLNGGSLLDLQEDFKITDIRNVEKVRYEVLLKDLRQDAYLDQKDKSLIPHSHSI